MRKHLCLKRILELEGPPLAKQDVARVVVATVCTEAGSHVADAQLGQAPSDVGTQELVVVVALRSPYELHTSPAWEAEASVLAEEQVATDRLAAVEERERCTSALALREVRNEAEVVENYISPMALAQEQMKASC